MQSLTYLCWQQIRREWMIQMRQKKSWLNSLLFFAMIVFFFPMTLPADPQLDRIIVPGVIWITLLLANLLAAERLFQVEHDEGILDLWLTSGQPLTLFVIAKIGVHWVLTLFPILMLLPIVAVLFHMNPSVTAVLGLSLLCGTLPILLLSGLAAAYGTVLPQKGILMGLIILPLILPILILGAATTTAAAAFLPVGGYLAYLTALSCFSLATIPFAITSVLKM